MRFFTTVVLATLTASAAALPVSSPADVSSAFAQSLREEASVEPVAFDKDVVEARANTPADVKKHDDNHRKLANNNCGQGCKESLSSFHSQASKDSKASKASQASRNSQNTKNSKSRNGKRDLANFEDVEDVEMEERDLENVEEAEMEE